ncbi:MAG: SoxR reducing system RseC family protein [Oscillospiraceae bacterium]|nr:SoxR reducing system RseC family protein [Oscillospiraceae bacterium]
MEQIVRVRQTYENGTAQVVCIRESACSGDCHKCSGCGAAKESILITAENPLGASAGDLVVVRSETGPVLKAAAVLYMMPLVLFFLGYYIGTLLGISGGIAGSAAFVLSVALIVRYDRYMAKKENTVYTITGYAGDSLLKSGRKGDNNCG